MKVNNEVFRELGVFLLIGAAVCAVLVFTGCSAPSVSAPASPSISIEPVGGLEEAAQVESRSQNSERASLSKNRPGLGTGWGRRINSSLSHTYFVRESNRPFGGVAAIYYNDKEGIEATAGPYKNKTSAYQRAANGAVEWGIKSGWRTPNHYMSGARRFVVGKKGRNYSLVVRNVSDSRLEIVLSVDGLDVLDGKAASFRKRGYILAPGEKIEVEGFRTGYDAVAAFRFSTVSASYSNLRHGQTRDVGVVGLAVFTEQGNSPRRWSNSEVRQREGARPFAEAPHRTVQ